MEQEEAVKILRSCLISSKGGIKLRSLQADYCMVTGEACLPFKQFGYPSVETFVRDIPDVTVTKKGGELYVEAMPSKSTTHLTKLISRQKSTRRKAPQSKKWISPRHNARSSSPAYKSNTFNFNFQANKTNHANYSNSFTKSTPGKSTLYTDFSRPVPLMEAVVQCPISQNNGKLEKSPKSAAAISSAKRLKDKVNPAIPPIYQSVTCKIDNAKRQVLNEQLTVIKPKTAEPKNSKLCERLKYYSNAPISDLPSLLGNPKSNISSHIPSLLDIPKVTPSVEFSDPRKELQNHANALNLSPLIYKMYSKKEKNSAKATIYASLKLGTHTFHTFPEDAASEEDAEKIAARLALIHLAKESSNPDVITVDEQVVKERILNIVTRHHGGVFMHLLPKYYNEQYGEALPDNWQRITEQCVEISQEKGVGDSMILCRSCPAQRSEAKTKDISETNFSSGDKIQLSPIGPAAPDKLEVPETTIWNVYTTCVISTVEVWVRLIDNDYNDNFVDMTTEMTKYYNEMKMSATTTGCIVGDFYAILEDNYWYRVQCIDIDSDTGIVTVSFIDGGYGEQCKPEALYPLDKRFCILPAQAIRVALRGLENFHDCPQIVADIENQLLGDRAFLVEVYSTDVDEYGSYATVTFYDTNGQDDVDINQVVFDKIINRITEASVVNIGKILDLYVTHIDESGKIYAQFNSLGRNYLMMHMPANDATCSPVLQISFTQMYLVKCDPQLHRARVIDIPERNKVTVFLVDIGRTSTISKQDLLHVDSMALQRIPPQATQIFLHQIDQIMYEEKLVTRFRELVSDTDLLLAKVLKKSPSGIPMVQIFKRIGPNNLLASINSSLIYDLEPAKANEDSNNNVKCKKRLERKNSRALESVSKLNPPTIPDFGQYFDVHVTLAAHPKHFIVQPLNTNNQLKALMLDLQKCYETLATSPLNSVGEEKLYAGKFRDSWYRVYVTNIINDNEVSVYFCDFGDVTIVSRHCLRALKSEFLKLPYQAVKAKLVGIEPINSDWSVGDCVRFKDLVLDKDFVSVVVDSVSDDLSPVNGTVLGLQLIDVSTEKDIYIDRLLVEERRAKYIDGFEERSPSN